MATTIVPTIPSQISLLVVEDHSLLLSLLEDIFDSLKFKTTSADNVQTALAHLNSGLKLDVLITDYSLADEITGVDLAIKATEFNPEIKIIITTGYESEMIYSLYPGTPFIIIEKPYDPYKIQELIIQSMSK